jgi:hypothetical protein
LIVTAQRDKSVFFFGGIGNPCVIRDVPDRRSSSRCHMNTIHSQNNHSFVVEKKLENGAISAFERRISMKFRAVKGRDAPIVIPNPQELLRAIKRKCCDGGRKSCWSRRREEQTPDLRRPVSILMFSEDIENVEATEASAPLVDNKLPHLLEEIRSG